jgi:hypothetical protein
MNAKPFGAKNKEGLFTMDGNLVPMEQHQYDIIEASISPQEMNLKLAEMKTKMQLMQKFFKEVMIKDQDYGVIPGTEKPTLLKPGAEKLCELYGYASVVKQVEEEKNIETGFYRARVTVALVHRRTGAVIAEGVGEANTMESRYRYRWVPEWKLPAGVDKNALYYEERTSKGGKSYRMYRLENSDPWTLWNTVLKMAKKRGHIDATLSATRSSGIFTQDLEDMEEWVAGAPSNGDQEQPVPQETKKQTIPDTPKPAKTKQDQTNGINWQAFWENAKNLGYDNDQVHAIASEIFNADVPSLKDVIPDQRSLNLFLQELAKRKKDAAKTA